MIFLVASLLNSYYLNLKVLFQERERKRGKTGEIWTAVNREGTNLFQNLLWGFVMGQIKINTSHSLWVMIAVPHRLINVKKQKTFFFLVIFAGNMYWTLSESEGLCLDTELLWDVKLCLVNLHLIVGSRREKSVCLPKNSL